VHSAHQTASSALWTIRLLFLRFLSEGWECEGGESEEEMKRAHKSDKESWV
jgi:hypothetical protein